METLVMAFDTIAHVLVSIGLLILYYRMYTKHEQHGRLRQLSWQTLKIAMNVMIATHFVASSQAISVNIHLGWILNTLSFSTLPLLGLWIQYGHGYQLKENLKHELKRHK